MQKALAQVTQLFATPKKDRNLTNLPSTDMVSDASSPQHLSLPPRDDESCCFNNRMTAMAPTTAAEIVQTASKFDDVLVR